MKRIAINLANCSKKDRKAAIKMAKANGYKWLDADRYSSDWDYLLFFDDKTLYCSYGNDLCQTINLPRDWDKIKSFLGIADPKDGEIWRRQWCEARLIQNIFFI